MYPRSAVTGTDGYKFSHNPQYPPSVRVVKSYLEARGGVYPYTTAYGALQYTLPKILKPITEEDIVRGRRMLRNYFGTDSMFNLAGWERILHKHGGRLPVTIRVVPEGTNVPTSNVLMTVKNEDPELRWVTNYLETRLSHTWFPYTVATLSHFCRLMILRHLEKSGSPGDIDFKLHDFGFRGVNSDEGAAIGGSAHLVNFMGTDTFPALELIEDCYHESFAGFSIPAAEHSTITSWGRAHEVDAYRNMLTQFPTGLVAVVSDSYDIYNACDYLWGQVLRDEVMKRDGTLVVRPDSGYPPDVVLRILTILGERFGVTVNAKGYRVLDPHVRVIQGDGCDPEMMDLVLTTIETAGWSADNVAFGMGGALLQKVNRDTQKYAFKCSEIVNEDGSTMDVWKDPITDPGKRSKGGELSLYRDSLGALGTCRITSVKNDVLNYTDVMVDAYKNGEFMLNDDWKTIRARAAQVPVL